MAFLRREVFNSEMWFSKILAIGGSVALAALLIWDALT